ncbi:hypothetical protein QQY79_23825, partial [Flavobacterium tructae]|uniref:hypothetical protein n=1 Tax=Flavobacterium tructae TaxID=1114873 RepID=UPI002551D39B
SACFLNRMFGSFSNFFSFLVGAKESRILYLLFFSFFCGMGGSFVFLYKKYFYNLYLKKKIKNNILFLLLRKKKKKNKSACKNTKKNNNKKKKMSK